MSESYFWQKIYDHVYLFNDIFQPKWFFKEFIEGEKNVSFKKRMENVLGKRLKNFAGVMAVSKKSRLFIELNNMITKKRQ